MTTEGPIRANNEYDGETYDARLENDGWCKPGFTDAGWKTRSSRGRTGWGDVGTDDGAHPNYRITEACFVSPNRTPVCISSTWDRIWWAGAA